MAIYRDFLGNEFQFENKKGLYAELGADGEVRLFGFYSPTRTVVIDAIKGQAKDKSVKNKDTTVRTQVFISGDEERLEDWLQHWLDKVRDYAGGIIKCIICAEPMKSGGFDLGNDVFVCSECGGMFQNKIEEIRQEKLEEEPDSSCTARESPSRGQLQSSLQNHCSFCSKSLEQVLWKLVVGPGVNICNDCIEVCRESIEWEDRPTISSSLRAKLEKTMRELPPTGIWDSHERHCIFCNESCGIFWFLKFGGMNKSGMIPFKKRRVHGCLRKPELQGFCSEYCLDKFVEEGRQHEEESTNRSRLGPTLEKAVDPNPERAYYDRLTSREKKVLSHLSGLHVEKKLIIERLDLSLEMLRDHKKSISAKLGGLDMKRILEWAIVNGFMPDDDPPHDDEPKEVRPEFRA